VKKPYSAVELERIRSACGNIRDLALVDFLYATGCRVSEVSHLDISDIDFDNLECTVIGKGNKERIVYLSDVAAMHLQEYLQGRKDVSEALFSGKGSDRLSKNGIEAALKRIGKKAKVENVHPHRFRRTLATNLLDRGMNIQDVAKILGHADLKTTQIYCFISQKNVKVAYQRYAA
jgi:site-specific recombinase XerD